jgi:hypothetical protein
MVLAVRTSRPSAAARPSRRRVGRPCWRSRPPRRRSSPWRLQTARVVCPASFPSATAVAEGFPCSLPSSAPSGTLAFAATPGQAGRRPRQGRELSSYPRKGRSLCEKTRRASVSPLCPLAGRKCTPRRMASARLGCSLFPKRVNQAWDDPGRSGRGRNPLAVALGPHVQVERLGVRVGLDAHPHRP